VDPGERKVKHLLIYGFDSRRATPIGFVILTMRKTCSFGEEGKKWEVDNSPRVTSGVGRQKRKRGLDGNSIKGLSGGKTLRIEIQGV